MPNVIVLGRFQPFHKGHEYLLLEALKSGSLVIAIGSSQANQEPDNPWSGEERKSMIEAWLESMQIEATVVCIPDINDPPNWVEHATKFHHEGILATSDDSTAELYRQSGWEIELISMSGRENLQGWRVRQTIKMMSMIEDENVLQSVMKESLPDSTIKWLLQDTERIRRLAFL